MSPHDDFEDLMRLQDDETKNDLEKSLAKGASR